MTATPSPRVQLQACLADPDDVSEYRFLVDGKDIKYVNLDPGVVPAQDLSNEHALLALLPAFPPGDWNEGHVTRDAATGRAVFAATTRQPLPGVQNVWHRRTVDHLQLVWLDRLRQNVRVVRCPGLADTDRPVVYKFATFPWETPRVEQETAAYGWLDGHAGLAPRFLAHVAEAGRVIGFLVDKVDGRPAAPADLAACRRTLQRVHALGIRHGDVNKHNFVITDDGAAVLVDWESAARCDDAHELAKELASLSEQLAEDSGRGGITYERSD